MNTFVILNKQISKPPVWVFKFPGLFLLRSKNKSSSCENNKGRKRLQLFKMAAFGKFESENKGF